MTKKLTLEEMYHPDGLTLGELWAGNSGSGKTTAVISTLQSAIASPAFGEKHRFLIIDPKTQAGDYDLLEEPVFNVEKAKKSLLKNRVTVLWPELDFLEHSVGQMIDYIFALSDQDLETTFTIIIDEASILITSTKIPTSLKKLAVQGRAKRIKPILISQRPIVNRWTDANMSALNLMRTMPVDSDTLSKRWGVDFTQAQSDLREVDFSWLRFDMGSGEVHRMPPVSLPKPKKRKKRSIVDKLKDLI